MVSNTTTRRPKYRLERSASQARAVEPVQTPMTCVPRHDAGIELSSRDENGLETGSRKQTLRRCEILGDHGVRSLGPSLTDSTPQLLHPVIAKQHCKVAEIIDGLQRMDSR